MIFNFLFWSPWKSNVSAWMSRLMWSRQSRMVAKLYGVLVTCVHIKVLSNLKIGQTKQIKNKISLHFQIHQPSNQRTCLLSTVFTVCVAFRPRCPAPHHINENWKKSYYQSTSNPPSPKTAQKHLPKCLKCAWVPKRGWENISSSNLRPGRSSVPELPKGTRPKRTCRGWIWLHKCSCSRTFSLAKFYTHKCQRIIRTRSMRCFHVLIGKTEDPPEETISGESCA